MAHRQLGRRAPARAAPGRRSRRRSRPPARACCHCGHLLGALVGEQDARGGASVVGDRRARARAAASCVPSAAAARTSTRWPKASGPSRSTARTSGSRSASGGSMPAVRRRRRQVLEVAPLLLRALAVHRLDPDQGAMALAAARRARRAGDLVAGAQLAAADLRGGDVDVALGLVQAAQAQEAVALRHPVEDAGDRLGLGSRPPRSGLAPASSASSTGPLLRLAARPLEARRRPASSRAAPSLLGSPALLDRLDQLVAASIR